MLLSLLRVVGFSVPTLLFVLHKLCQLIWMPISASGIVDVIAGFLKTFVHVATATNTAVHHLVNNFQYA